MLESSVIEYNSDSMRQRGNIFLSSAGFVTRIEKNAASQVVRSYQYDTPVYLLENVSPGTGVEIKIDPDSGSNFNMFYVGDMIALREEDGTAEPLPTNKEEFCLITDIDKNNSTITVNAVVNSYTVDNCYIYTVIKSEKYQSGFDKTVTIVEVWRNN